MLFTKIMLIQKIKNLVVAGAVTNVKLSVNVQAVSLLSFSSESVRAFENVYKFYNNYY